MIIEFDLTSEDMNNWWNAVMTCSGSYRQSYLSFQQSRRKYSKNVSILAILLAVALFLPMQSSTHWLAAGVIVGLMIALLLSWNRSTESYWRTQVNATSMRQRTMQDKEPRLGRYRFELSEQGVQCHSPNVIHDFNWNAVMRLEKVCDGLLIFRHDQITHFIPTRVFQSVQERDEAIMLIESGLQTSPYSALCLLSTYFAGRDFQCPKCHYNLRDHRGTRCSECGEILDWVTVPGAFGVPGPNKRRVVWSGY